MFHTHQLSVRRVRPVVITRLWYRVSRNVAAVTFTKPLPRRSLQSKVHAEGIESRKENEVTKYSNALFQVFLTVYTTNFQLPLQGVSSVFNGYI